MINLSIQTLSNLLIIPFLATDVISSAIIGGIIGGAVALLASIPLIMKQVQINKGQSKAKPGNRYTQEIAFTGDWEILKEKIDKLVISRQYLIFNYVDEVLFKSKGSGMFVATKFLKIQYLENKVSIEAFIIAFGAKEIGIDGFVGALPKKQLKTLVGEIINLINKEQNYQVF